MDIRKNLPEFGDFCSVEQHRHGAANEFYGYKVLGHKRSNSWVEVPVKGDAEAVLHDHLAYVVSCVPNSVGEHMPINFRVEDLHRVIKAKAFQVLVEVIEIAEVQRFNGKHDDPLDRGWRSAFEYILRHIQTTDFKEEAKRFNEGA